MKRNATMSNKFKIEYSIEEKESGFTEQDLNDNNQEICDVAALFLINKDKKGKIESIKIRSHDASSDSNRITLSDLTEIANSLMTDIHWQSSSFFNTTGLIDPLRLILKPFIDSYINMTAIYITNIPRPIRWLIGRYFDVDSFKAAIALHAITKIQHEELNEGE